MVDSRDTPLLSFLARDKAPKITPSMDDNVYARRAAAQKAVSVESQRLRDESLALMVHWTDEVMVGMEWRGGVGLRRWECWSACLCASRRVRDCGSGGTGGGCDALTAPHLPTQSAPKSPLPTR